MGALHAGHLSLIRHAAQENDTVFVSIYVNPTQFGLNEDLDSYPKTWSQDITMLEKLNDELKGTKDFTVFAPTTKTMYPTLPPDSSLPGTGSFVTITPLASLLEGKTRPVFFRGVATVCMKLFNICTPERVYFGQKDVQQTIIIKRMVKDFHLDTEVRVVGTSREPDGLAMSSRNVYLGARRRKVGIVLYNALKAAEEAYTTAGKRGRDEILAQAWEVVNSTLMRQDSLEEHERARFEVDYLSLADPETLEEVQSVDEGVGAVLSGAIKMLPLEAVQETEVFGMGGDQGPVRLIDNMILGAVEG
ncbi:pantoate-beta-alanine ligase [Elasticomyces elasticus]|nr:pantoate-beta-alanine ligase [Elasticomyces elasticus]